MNRIGQNITSFVTGTILGISIGVLFAPDKGTITRHKFAFRLEKYRNRLKDLVSKYSSDLVLENNDEVMTIAKSESMKVVSDAKAQAEALLNDVEELISQIKGKKI